MFNGNNGSPDRESGRPEGVSKEQTIGRSDPFGDLESLRLSQNFVAQTGVKPLLASIPVRKPNRHEFIRVRPGNEWRFNTGCLTDATTKEVYIVTASLVDELRGDVKPTCLRTCISRDSKVPFLWPITLPGPDGRWNRWHESAAAAAELAETQWLKVAAVMSAGNYSTHVAPATISEPDWPADLSLNDLLRLAFKERFIDNIDHLVLRRLRGEI